MYVLQNPEVTEVYTLLGYKVSIFSVEGKAKQEISRSRRRTERSLPSALHYNSKDRSLNPLNTELLSHNIQQTLANQD
jgi:hypothetical protein